MLSRTRRRHIPAMEALEQREMLTAATELVTHFDNVAHSARAGRYFNEVTAAGDKVYQRVGLSDDNVSWTAQWSLWRIDGETPRRIEVEGGIGSHVESVKDQLYFTSNPMHEPGGHGGNELWRTDGTQEGTARVAMAQIGGIDDLTAYQGKLFFSRVVDQQLGLWVTDGTETGTELVKDVEGDIQASVVDGTLVFTVVREDETELWKSDGTRLGAELVTAIPGRAHIEATTQNQLFLRTWEKEELWRTDGTDQGTYRLSAPHAIERLVTAGDKLFYIAQKSRDEGFREELWVTDGTVEGTQLVKEIDRGQSVLGCGPAGLLSSGNILYFSAQDENGGRQLWKTDGTQEGTVVLADMAFSPLFSVNSMVYLAGYDQATGAELWRSDGTTDGTVLAFDLTPGPEGSQFGRQTDFTVSPGMVYIALGPSVWRFPLETEPVDRIFGDSNHDGVFDSSDLVRVFQAGKYEDDIAQNTSFDEGDWNGDGEFDSSDLVAAFQTGTYVSGSNQVDIAAAIESLRAVEDVKTVDRNSSIDG